MIRPHDERGAMALMTAFCMVAVIGFSALAVDLGMGRQIGAQARSSADFAALAAAGVLKNGTAAQAEAAARAYIEKNGFAGAAAQVHIPPVSGRRQGDPTCVQVRPFVEMPAILGGLFLDSFEVAAVATACISPGLGGPYAVFAGSTTCPSTLSFSGANRTINGGVHSNNDMKIVSSGTTLNGDVTFLNGDPPSGNITFNPSTGNPRRLDAPLAYPEVFAIEDYAPGGAKALLAQSQGRYHSTSSEINESWLTLHGLLTLNNPLFPLSREIASGLYYTTANVHLNGHHYRSAPGGVTIVSSSGQIHINGNNHTFTPWDPDGLLLFSNKLDTTCNGTSNSVIKLNGNQHLWTGIMFAPRGPIDFAGTNIVASLNGRLVADTVKLSGSSQTITRNEIYPGRTDGFELVE